MDITAQYASACPFPHIVLDGYFDHARVQKAAHEAAVCRANAEKNFYGQHGKAHVRDLFHMGPATRGLIEEMNDEGFVAWLEQLTGIDGLVADMSLTGGGAHFVKRGGFLKIHTDFNWHAGLQKHRRVNVLLYLNEGWRSEWGGNLELWSTDMSYCGALIAPLLNRMVIFSTTDDSYHGHPEPLDCPDGVTRNSLALYYYSENPACSRFGRSEMTNYRERPAEVFSRRHKVHQALIKHPGLRRMIGR